MTKMKKIFAVLLVVMMLFALVACGGGNGDSSSSSTDDGSSSSDSSSSTAGGKDPKDVQLAGLVFSDDQFMNALLRGYSDAAKEFGVNEVNAQNVANDAAKEAELINTYISQKYDGIAIAPLNKEGSIPTLKAASDAGILIATTNMSLNEENAGFIVGGYTSDDFTNGVEIGKYAAGWIKENIDGDVNIALMDFDHSLPDQSGARWKGFLQGLDDSGVTYEVVSQQSNTQQEPLALASNQLTSNPEINVFFANNEGSTIGVAMAVEAAGKTGDIGVFGYDASDQISAMILDENSPLLGVVTQDPYTMGFKAMTLLCEVIINGADYSATKGTTEFVPGEVLTKSDLAAVEAWRTANGL